MATTQELSWLHFNRRVLAQTNRRDFPALERLRFLAIWASNMDEFFAARISRPFLEERGNERYRALLAEARAQAPQDPVQAQQALGDAGAQQEAVVEGGRFAALVGGDPALPHVLPSAVLVEEVVLLPPGHLQARDGHVDELPLHCPE